VAVTPSALTTLLLAPLSIRREGLARVGTMTLPVELVCLVRTTLGQLPLGSGRTEEWECPRFEGGVGGLDFRGRRGGRGSEGREGEEEEWDEESHIGGLQVGR
jgi:hypothetical protein